MSSPKGVEVGVRTKCRSCGKPIFWLETTKGRMMPIDAKAEQRVVAVQASDHLVLAGKQDLDVGDARARVIATYTAHFASCPNAGEWRNRR